MILDNGTEFTSNQFLELCKSHKINTRYTTPYHPQGNSISEYMHCTMKTVLNLLCEGHPYHWPKYLGETQRVLNTAVHTTLSEQPHYVFFSRRALRQVLCAPPMRKMLAIRLLIRLTRSYNKPTSGWLVSTEELQTETEELSQ